MNQPLISVIVPIYQVEQYLSQCVDSILNQTYTNLQIILVDDGSPDGCGRICDEYARKDARIHVIHKKNGGVSSARNMGLDAAEGEYLCFVDGDDWIEPDTYERMMAHMQGDPSLDIVMCCCTRYPNKDGEVRYAYYPTGTVVSGREVAKKMLLDEIGSQIWLGMYQRSCWEEVRFPVGQIYEDIAVTYRAFLKARFVGFLTEPFYFYRVNMQSITTTPVATKSYHIFLAFKAHYLGAKEQLPEVADQCCAMAAHYAVSTYFHYCATGAEELKAVVPDVLAYLNEHRNTVRENWDVLPKSRKLALRVYYLSPGLFRLCVRLLQVTGLRKKLGYDYK